MEDDKGGQDPQRLDGILALVVDDDEDTLDLECLVLKLAGAEVECLRDAAAAMAVAERRCPTVLIADLSMPVDDGFSLVRQFRTHPDGRLRSVPIVALSAHAGADVEQRALAAGFDLFLTKPIYPGVLVEAISTLVRRDAS